MANLNLTSSLWHVDSLYKGNLTNDQNREDFWKPNIRIFANLWVEIFFSSRCNGLIWAKNLFFVIFDGPKACSRIIISFAICDSKIYY